MVPVDAAPLLPGADRRAVRRPARQPPAAPRDRHQLGGQLDGQPGRHHVRLPGRGGDRRHPGAGGPRVRGLPRGLRPDAPTSPRSRRSTTSSPPAPRPRSTWSSAGCSTARCAGSCRTARRRWTSAPRSSASARSWPSTARRCCPCCWGRSASGSSAGSPSWRRPARRARSRPGRPGCSTSSRCSTWSRSAAETGRDASEVAPVYFATSEQFGIDGMLIADHPAAARRPLGRPGPRRAALRPLRGAGVADHVGPRGQRPRADRRRADRAVGEDQRRVADPGPRPRSSGIERIENPGIAALSVALRTLRGVIRSGAATT